MQRLYCPNCASSLYRLYITETGGLVSKCVDCEHEIEYVVTAYGDHPKSPSNVVALPQRKPT
jgi:NAD-dependent SIR2 family protein deacetylase